MFFTLRELEKWFGMTLFELCVNLSTVLIFSLLCVLKHEGVLNASWWYIFIPLFIADGLNAYLCIIIFLRMCIGRDYRWAALRLLSSMLILIPVFIAQFLFCDKLSGNAKFSYSEVFAPTFIPLFVLMIRACEAENT